MFDVSVGLLFNAFKSPFQKGLAVVSAGDDTDFWKSIFFHLVLFSLAIWQMPPLVRVSIGSIYFVWIYEGLFVDI